MASFTANQAFNTSATPVIDENTVHLLVSASTDWSFSDGHVTYAYSGTGFTFSPDGEILTGIVTGWSVSVDGAPLFTLTGGSYAVDGPNNPSTLVGHDLWEGGYLLGTDHPVYHEEAEIAWHLKGNDTITGSSGNDDLSGYEGSDIMNGGAGDDTLRGWHANDTIDGGAGIDTSYYYNARDITTITKVGTGWTVSFTANGSQIDTLTNIERLRFSGDVRVALDLDGNAGQVAKLLGAVFGATSVSNATYVGIGLGYADGGMNYEALGQLALQAAGAQTNEAVVQLLWHNVVGGTIDAGNLAYYVGMLTGGMSRGALATLAADTSYNAANIGLTGLMQTGLAYQM